MSFNFANANKDTYLAAGIHSVRVSSVVGVEPEGNSAGYLEFNFTAKGNAGITRQRMYVKKDRSDADAYQKSVNMLIDKVYHIMRYQVDEKALDSIKGDTLTAIGSSLNKLASTSQRHFRLLLVEKETQTGTVIASLPDKRPFCEPEDANNLVSVINKPKAQPTTTQNQSIEELFG